jgi:hypothetical protein
MNSDEGEHTFNQRRWNFGRLRPLSHLLRGDHMSISAETFFKPGRVSADGKLALTTITAKSILEREAAERAEKNECLRELRLAQTAAL